MGASAIPMRIVFIVQWSEPNVSLLLPLTVFTKNASPCASQSCPHGFVVPAVSTSTSFRTG